MRKLNTNEQTTNIRVCMYINYVPLIQTLKRLEFNLGICLITNVEGDSGGGEGKEKRGGNKMEKKLKEKKK